MPTVHTHPRQRRRRLASLLQVKPDTTFKDQLLLRTYPGTERSSLPTAGMHDRVQILQALSTNAQNHQTRDHPDMFPLHDVLEPAEHFNDARCALNVFSETCFFGRSSSNALERSDQPSGGARRDRTDDLMLAKHALSQLSYGPMPECLARKLAVERPARRAARPNGRRARLRERPVGQRQNMVGLGGLEPPTSRLSSARSNQLSYKPEALGALALVHGRKRNEGGDVPHVGSD